MASTKSKTNGSQASPKLGCPATSTMRSDLNTSSAA
jgi:hypothetical protein